MERRSKQIAKVFALSVTGVLASARGAVLDGGDRHTVALKADGTVAAWGANGSGQTSVPSGLSGAVAVAAGIFHTVALKSDGTVAAWGTNGSGQGTVPGGLNSVVAIAAGGNHNLALKSDGTVTAWGANNAGQCNVPFNLSGVVSVAGGSGSGDHSLALNSDGTVIAWGLNTSGQSTVPANLNDTIAIAAGERHSLALRSDGTIIAWGSNAVGQTNVPAGLTGVVGLAGGGDHSLALKSDGTVVGWGWNANGQTSPPGGLSNVVAVAASTAHSMALKNDGTVEVWGWNAYGQTNVPGGLFSGTPARWLKSVDGLFLGGYNWTNETPSTAVSDAVFDVPGVYTVTVTTESRAKSLNILQGDVTFDMGSNALIAGPVVNNAAFSQGGGTATVGAVTGTGVINVTAGTLTASSIRQDSLTISGSGNVNIAVNGGNASTSRIGTIAMSGGCKIDLTDNDLIVRAMTYSAVESLVKSGFDNFDWLGTGITSSTAATFAQIDGSRAVGVIDNADGGYQTFGGQSVSATDILVKFTWVADANLDGFVDNDDFGQFLYGYNGGGSARWLNGDFDYNGVVDNDDFGWFLTGLSAFQASGNMQLSDDFRAELASFASEHGLPLTLPVPEPAGVAILGIAAGLLVRKRRNVRSVH